MRGDNDWCTGDDDQETQDSDVLWCLIQPSDYYNQNQQPWQGQCTGYEMQIPCQRDQEIEENTIKTF